MKRYKLIPYICSGIAAACVFTGFALKGYWYGSIAAFIVGLIWFLNIHRHNAWLLHIALVLSITSAVTGAWLESNKAIMLASIVLFLASWDLALFQKQIDGKVANSHHPIDIRPHQRHAKILAGVLVAGLILSMAGLFLVIPTSFGWLFLLALIAAVSLSRFAVHWQRRIKK